jgi:photosystem II stability/assembly factor-like uncharacterized protein
VAPPPAAVAGAAARGVGVTMAARSADAQTSREVIEVVTPDPRIRWRVLNGRDVAKTANAGADWQAAVLTSAASLLAGYAPRADVVWFVGERGTIYVTGDAERFDLVPFPENTDLISVTAVDGQQATVRARDGRTWRTTDRGNSWVAIP